MSRFSKDSKINNLVIKKIQSGWEYKKGKKHDSLIAPNNRRIAIPCTPSDYRASRNFARDVKKLASII